ncbi:hypothetical protein TWF106_003996 [Orbilia oligospora]|uniref:Fido domain-containing protein n=1 Tax=Orbilia oligospora TaxID=2813651 RepID=A0A7C8Q668_ORBOL|nr:hypothetical protein TWF106_003996 [Orbilia oligospora]
MASEFETVRTRILTGSGSSTPTRRPSLPTIAPLTPFHRKPPPPENTASPLTNPNFITLLITHLSNLSTTRISQGFLHLHPSPIHTPLYLPSPLPYYTHLTDLLRRIDINLSTIPHSKLQRFFSHLLSRQIHCSNLLSNTGTDYSTTQRISTSIFTSTGITELNLPHTKQYTSEINYVTSHSLTQRERISSHHHPTDFGTVLKGRDDVYNYAKALVHFLTTLISPGGELTQDLIKQTHRILVTDNPVIDSKPWDQYGGWYRDYRLLTPTDPIPHSQTASSTSFSSHPSTVSHTNKNSPPTPRRSSSIYTFNQPDFRRTSSIYSLPPEDYTPRRLSSYSGSISTPSSLATSPTSPRRGSSLYYPITPITELCEEEEKAEEELESPSSQKHQIKDEELFPSLSHQQQQSIPDLRARRESIDPRAVSMYMSKLISTYHAQLAMDRSTSTDPNQRNIEDMLREQEEEETISDPFALSAWLVTEFMHIHPFITANEEMSRIILSGVLMKELGIVLVLGDPEDGEGGREEYLGIMERCEERHRENGQEGYGESYAEFAALVVRKAVEGVEKIATMVGRS